jgi:hypothetical protein
MNGDLIAPTVPEADLRDEVNRRTAKSGYTTRYGECRAGTRIQGLVKWGKQKLNVWPRDKNGNLIQ